jgi:hypothetical protein
MREREREREREKERQIDSILFFLNSYNEKYINGSEKIKYLVKVIKVLNIKLILFLAAYTKQRNEQNF